MATTLPLITSGTVRGACPHDCPDTCAMITTVEDGRAVRIQGDPDHPFTQGFLCAKVNRYLERTYHPDRLTHPLRRVGPKGSGTFERVSWDDALADIARNLRRVIDQQPRAATPASSSTAARRPTPWPSAPSAARRRNAAAPSPSRTAASSAN
jgi:anaerobic selenocysteine-containing dehydrogenase